MTRRSENSADHLKGATTLQMAALAAALQARVFSQKLQGWFSSSKSALRHQLLICDLHSVMEAYTAWMLGSVGWRLQ
jgi:hypothetical protein